MDEDQAERAKAMAVVEKYFDVDIQTADDAMDILIDNGVRYDIALGIAHDIYPPNADAEEE